MSAPAARNSKTAGAETVAPLRPISFGNPAVTVERRPDGTIYLRPVAQLGDYPVRLTDRLHHWAAAAPDRVFMAERKADGSWRELTYAQLLTSSRAIASALLTRGLSAEKPINFVFHGGSGSTQEEIREAISYGAIKMNIDTDMQWAFWEGIKDYYQANEGYLQSQIGNPKGEDAPNKKYYDPRVWLRKGEEQFVKRLTQAFADLNCIDVTAKL